MRIVGIIVNRIMRENWFYSIWRYLIGKEIIGNIDRYYRESIGNNKDVSGE